MQTKLQNKSSHEILLLAGLAYSIVLQEKTLKNKPKNKLNKQTGCSVYYFNYIQKFFGLYDMSVKS